MREENPRGGTEHEASHPPVLPVRARRRHDFATPRLLAEKQVRALDRMHRKFAQAVSTALSVLARTKVRVDLLEVSQKPYFEFIRSLGSPTSLHLVYCLPQKIPFVLETSPRVLFPVIERMLGGRGEDTVEPARPLTRIEQSLARSIAEELLRELRQAWCCGVEASRRVASSPPASEGLAADAQPETSADGTGSEPGLGSMAPNLQFDIAETEHNPLLMQIVGPAEPAVVLSFQVTLPPPGTVAPGTVAPGTVAPGTVAPGTVAPGTLGTSHYGDALGTDDPSAEIGQPLAVDRLTSCLDDYARRACPPDTRDGLTRGSFNICLPTRLFHPILSRLTRFGSAGMQADRNSPHERDQILRQLAGTRIAVSAELAAVPLALTDLLGLRPGDVIDTQLNTTNEATLLFEGRAVLRGKPATCQGQRAIQVTRYAN